MYVNVSYKRYYNSPYTFEFSVIIFLDTKFGH
jgi:hypothetical protein